MVEIHRSPARCRAHPRSHSSLIYLGSCYLTMDRKSRLTNNTTTKRHIMYPHFAGGSLRHPSCVLAVHHSFTEIDLHHSYILHNIRSIYMHIRRRDPSSDLHHVFTAQFLYSKIIVKIGINTPIFAHINVNAISPHLNLRF